VRHWLRRDQAELPAADPPAILAPRDLASLGRWVQLGDVMGRPGSRLAGETRGRQPGKSSLV
jgi:hypothetical protein